MKTKRNLINDIKALKANHKSLREFAKEKYIDENGVANIHLYVNNDDIYNKMTNPKAPELSDEVISFIEKEAYYIPAEYPINVVFHSSDDLDDEYIEKKLKEYYWKRLADKDDDLKRNSLTSLILLIIGATLLSLYFVLESIQATKDLFNEIFSIAGSFSVWESVDYFLIVRSVLKIEQLNIAQLALLTVEIKDNEKE